MTTKNCACCGEPFTPRPQVPDQAYCSAPFGPIKVVQSQLDHLAGPQPET